MSKQVRASSLLRKGRALQAADAAAAAAVAPPRGTVPRPPASRPVAVSNQQQRTDDELLRTVPADILKSNRKNMMAEMPLDVALGFLPSSLPASRHPADCPPLLAVLDEAACKAARLRAVHKTDLLPAVLLKRGVRQILDSESGGIGHLMLDAVHVGGRTLTQRQEYNARASSTQSRPNSHVIQEPARFIHAQGDGIAAFTVSPNAQTSAWQALQKVTRGEEKPLVQKVYGRPTRIYTYTCFFAHPDDVVSGDISIDRLHSVCSHRRGNPAAPATCGCVPKEGGYEVQDTLFTQVNGVFELHSIVEYTVVIYKDAGGSNRGAAAAAAVRASGRRGQR